MNATDETQNDVEQIQQLMFDGLTRKQAAIVVAWKKDRGMTFAETAREAADLLPDDTSITAEYVSAQLHERFPDYFGDEGVEEQDTVEVPVEDWNRLQTIVTETAN